MLMWIHLHIFNCVLARLLLIKCQPFIGYFEMTRVYCKSSLHARLKRKEGRDCSMLRLVYTEVMKWIASVAHAGRIEMRLIWPSGWKQRLSVGREEKFPTRRGRTTLTEPLQSHFLCLWKTFPATRLHFVTPLRRFYVSERSPTFLLPSWKHQHHGAALPWNGHHHTSSPRSEPFGRWQSAAELADHRGEVFTSAFLF